MLVSNPGDLAQMVERLLSMQEVGGSMPPFSILFNFLAIQHHYDSLTG